jgi:hypothetical protein
MTKIKSSQLVAGALFALCLATGPAEATVDHTYAREREPTPAGASRLLLPAGPSPMRSRRPRPPAK